MKSEITNENTNEFRHVLLQINDEDDNCDWGYRVYGVQEAQKVLLCESSAKIAAGAVSSSRSLVICTKTDPATLQELAIPTNDLLHSTTLDAPITHISTDTYIAAATETHLHVLNRDLQLLHKLESPSTPIYSLRNRYIAYVHPHSTTCSGIIASKNLKYADRPSYTTAEIASHLASYIEEGYKQGHKTFDALRNTYYTNTFSKSVPLTSPSIEVASPPLLSTSPTRLAERNGLFNRRPSVVKVLDIVTGRTAALFEGSIASVSHISLSPSGRSVLVADTNAHTFHIYELRPRPIFDRTREYDSVWHRYALSRGYTTARVTSASWTEDERWVGVTTDKGTTHIYPLNPNIGGMTTDAHVTGEVIKLGCRHTPLSTTLSSPIKIKSKMVEDRPNTSRNVSFAFSGNVRGKLTVYTIDNDLNTFTQLHYKLSWRESKKEDESLQAHLHTALDATCDVQDAAGHYQPANSGTSTYTASKSRSQISRGEIETFDVSVLRSIFSSRQFEFRAASAEVVERYADDASALIQKSRVYRVRTEVRIDKKDSTDVTIDKNDEMDLSSIQHVIPALPNGVEHKSSLSLPDQRTLKKILKGSYNRISSTFGSPGSPGSPGSMEVEYDDAASIQGEVNMYKEAKDASEEADRFVVGLVDDDEEELEEE